MRLPYAERKLPGSTQRQPRSSVDPGCIKKGKAMIAAYIIKQYERAVVFKLGKVNDEARGPGLIFVVPFVQRIRRVSLRIVTMPIQSQRNHHQGQRQHRRVRSGLLPGGES